MANQQVDCSKSVKTKSNPITIKLWKYFSIYPIHWSPHNHYLMKLIVIIFLSLTIGYILNSSDYSKKTFFYLIRIFLLKVKLFWDWSYVGQNRCLLFNNQPSILIKQGKKDPPSVSTVSLANHLPFQCYSCQDLNAIKRLILSAHSRDEIEDDILNKVPFIVSHENSSDTINISNPIQSWPIFSNANHSIEILNQIYSTLDDNDVCMFASNVQVTSPNQLFNNLNRQSKPWFANWENCVSRSKKRIRQLYRRPDFIPNFIELTHPNWILISGSNYVANKWKHIDLTKATKIGIVVQIIGHNGIRLTPRNECYRFGCDSIEIAIKPSDFLIYNTMIWKLSYLPANESLNLALVLGGSHETN